MADCPHGMSSPAWCDKCIASDREKLVDELRDIGALPSDDDKERQTAVSGSGATIINSTNGDRIDVNSSDHMLVRLSYRGKRYIAWTRNKFSGASCRACKKKLAIDEPVAKSLVTSNWLCIGCWMNDKRSTPEDNAEKKAFYRKKVVKR